MRSIWKGSIAFGLVNVPIKVYAATETHDISMHQVHDEDKARIRYKRVCELGHEVEYANIERAYDDGERTVVLTSKDLGSLPEEQSHEIEVLEFVPSEQVDPIMFEKAYYLEPDSRSPKAYVLLRETLDRTDRTAVVQFTLRQKTRLGVLRVHGDVLLLQGLLWADEVRAADFANLAADTKVSANELKMSSSLVESMSNDFDPDKFTDEYQVQLQKLIDAKLEAGDDVDTAATFGEQDSSDEGEGGDVIDLMAALRASVDKNRKRRSGGSGDDAHADDGHADDAESDEETPAPRRRSPRSTTAKKTSTGTTKSTASTSTASKSTATKSTTKSGTSTAKKPAARKKAS